MATLPLLVGLGDFGPAEALSVEANRPLRTTNAPRVDTATFFIFFSLFVLVVSGPLAKRRGEGLTALKTLRQGLVS